MKTTAKERLVLYAAAVGVLEGKYKRDDFEAAIDPDMVARLVTDVSELRKLVVDLFRTAFKGRAAWPLDYACWKCVPNQGTVEEGFVCAMHRAEELWKTTQTGD